MKVMVDIHPEEIVKAYNAIQEKKGICRILPTARFDMCDWDNEIKYNGLVCNPKMEGKQTGVGVECCKNCVGGRNKNE